MEIEVWLPMAGFDNYEVSNLGSIRNVIIGKPKRPYSDNFGYKKVILYKDGKTHTKLVHRLVAIAFIPTNDLTLTVNHKNFIKHDNRVSNLEWMSRAENIHHAWSGFRMNKILSDTADEIRELYSSNKMSIKEICTKYGIKKSNAYNICCNKSWSSNPIINNRKLKLTNDDIQSIFSMSKNKTQKEIARYFNITQVFVSQILLNKVSAYKDFISKNFY